jgi:methylisocitrate lyase
MLDGPTTTRSSQACRVDPQHDRRPEHRHRPRFTGPKVHNQASPGGDATTPAAPRQRRLPNRRQSIGPVHHRRKHCSPTSDRTRYLIPYPVRPAVNPLSGSEKEPSMTYLVAEDLPTSPAGDRFRALLARPGILQLPGAHNGQAGLQAKQAGFDGLYLSGAAMTASMGIPDLGMITVDEVCFFVRQIARATGLPLLVDGDTGYGEALNVMHMIRSFEDAGAGAVHIEDQLLPKKCGHLNDKKLADPHDMAAKIAAARKARRHLYIIARTDAAASEGIDGSVGRAKLFMDAGADAIFPEALITAEMFKEVAARLPGVPLLANMTEFGRTPFFTAAEFEAMGYKMVIWPVSSLRIANKAQQKLYAAIKKDGGTQNMVDYMQTRAELYATIGYHDYEALDASIVTTIIPQAMPQQA